MNQASKITSAVFVCMFAAVLMYGVYWVAKTVSYQVFYKDMVKQTVIEMVKENALRRNQ